MICLLLFAVCVNTGFADYIGPNPDLRTYVDEHELSDIAIEAIQAIFSYLEYSG